MPIKTKIINYAHLRGKAGATTGFSFAGGYLITQLGKTPLSKKDCDYASAGLFVLPFATTTYFAITDYCYGAMEDEDNNRHCLIRFADRVWIATINFGGSFGPLLLGQVYGQYPTSFSNPAVIATTSVALVTTAIELLPTIEPKEDETRLATFYRYLKVANKSYLRTLASAGPMTGVCFTATQITNSLAGIASAEPIEKISWLWLLPIIAGIYAGTTDFFFEPADDPDNSRPAIIKVIDEVLGFSFDIGNQFGETLLFLVYTLPLIRELAGEDSLSDSTANYFVLGLSLFALIFSAAHSAIKVSEYRERESCFSSCTFFKSNRIENFDHSISIEGRYDTLRDTAIQDGHSGCADGAVAPRIIEADESGGIDSENSACHRVF